LQIFEARYPAHLFPCLRFTGHLTAPSAKLGAKQIVTLAQALEIVEQAIGETEARNGNALFGFVAAIECCVNAAQFLLDARALDSRIRQALPTKANSFNRTFAVGQM